MLRFPSRFKPYIPMVCIVLGLTIVLEFVNLNLDIRMFHNIVLYTSAALVQAYAALIAIPFTIAVVHLQSRYGSIAVEFLFRYSLRVFIILGIIFASSFFIMIVAGTSIPEQNINVMYVSLIMLAAILLLPLPSIVNYIRSLFTLKPSDIVEFLFRSARVHKELNSNSYDKLRETLSRAFLLAGLSMLDPSSELELSKIINKISNFLSETIIPYLEKMPEPVDNKNIDDKQVKKELILLIFNLLNNYIVNYLRYSKIQKPLIPLKDLHPLIITINDIVRIAILKKMISIGREYCYFVHSLREIMLLYIEDKRIGEVLDLYRQVHLRLLESRDNTLDLRRVQRVMLDKPGKYSEERLLPYTYDFYIDYVATIPCMLFKLLLEKLTQEDLKSIGESLFHIMVTMLLDYPVLLASYTFKQHGCECSRDCTDSIVELILKQDEVYGPLLLTLLIAWMTKAYIVAKNVLNEDDRKQVIENIRALSSKLLKSLNERNIVTYVKLYDTGELKLIFNSRSVSLSRYIYDEGSVIELISKYDNKKICAILRDVLELETRNC